MLLWQMPKPFRCQDTKYEFGLDDKGVIHVIDEVTPHLKPKSNLRLTIILNIYCSVGLTSHISQSTVFGRKPSMGCAAADGGM